MPAMRQSFRHDGGAARGVLRPSARNASAAPRDQKVAEHLPLVLQTQFDADEAIELIERHRCTSIYTLPAMTGALVRSERSPVKPASASNGANARNAGQPLTDRVGLVQGQQLPLQRGAPKRSRQ
jgi:hypothetical protein